MREEEEDVEEENMEATSSSSSKGTNPSLSKRSKHVDDTETSSQSSQTSSHAASLMDESRHYLANHVDRSEEFQRQMITHVCKLTTMMETLLHNDSARELELKEIKARLGLFEKKGKAGTTLKIAKNAVKSNLHNYCRIQGIKFTKDFNVDDYLRYVSKNDDTLNDIPIEAM